MKIFEKLAIITFEHFLKILDKDVCQYLWFWAKKEFEYVVYNYKHARSCNLPLIENLNHELWHNRHPILQSYVREF